LKPPPQQLRNRVFDLLRQDIADPNAKGFDRLNALKAVADRFGMMGGVDGSH
jgi:hypothetical protein